MKLVIVVLMFQISLLNTELVLATEVDVIHPVEDSETSGEDTGKSDILGGTENNKTTAENSQSTSENVSDKFEVNETWKESREQRAESREQRAVGDIIITGNAVYVITADSEVELYQAVPTNGAIVVPNIISNNGKDYIVTSISDQACVSGGVTSVTFPDSIVKIGNSAFGDNDLTNLVLPSSLKYIGAGAFDKNLLTNVDIPDGVTFIGQAAFYDNQLKSVTIPDSVTTMEAQAFQGNQLEHIRIPKGISVLEYSVFFDNKLTNIDIPDGVTTIGVAAFERNLLTNVDIPDSVTSIEEFAFYDNQLKSITIPDSVTTIGERAFQNNPDLLVYDIPTNSNIASVMSISGWGNAGVNSNATMTQAGLVRAEWNDANRGWLRVLIPVPNNAYINFYEDSTLKYAIPYDGLDQWDGINGVWTNGLVTATPPANNPTKTGHTFTGWEDEQGDLFDFSTTQLDLNNQNEFNFYAAFEKKEYTVTFDIDGKKETQKVLFEGLINEPVAPKKEKHTFEGWHTSPQTKATKWDFNTMGMPANHLTLYAKFTKLSDSGSGTDSGGSGTPSKPVSPEKPGNKESTNDLNSNAGGTTITNQENIVTSSETSQQNKLAKLGEQNSMILQGFGLLMIISGIAFFWWKRKNAHS
ncbi:LPXTG cell wall anchor domain-containing protein [Listeria monocytogenes]|nr:LPXTG cell wall anchor domain-containing protein [Listeria monocytogenes]EAD8590422.1 LPXTG cell wall anchor domain-containing protein [Listeria monocytogenes]EAD8593517.1 LPXTG cell wall anchor domain-containing protein [Listeria monocytogenes]EAD8602467.1 LPXTG cell wall anchor domain-containing protein [Listeria monocytogenes]